MIFLRIGAWSMGILALLSLGVLGVGLLLPSTWSAEAEIRIDAPPEALYPQVHRAQGWMAWTPVPDTGVERFGPDAGAGSGYRWDDPAYGAGEFTLLQAVPGQEVQYQVDVEGGSIRIFGFLTLIPDAAGDDATRVSWREEGDFGWNPLLGYLSGRMEALQGEQLAQSLAALQALVEGAGGEVEVNVEGKPAAPGAASDTGS